MPPLFMKPLWILASRRGIAQRLRDETTQIIHYLSSLIPGRQQQKKKKLIINHSNKLGMFFTLSPRSPCQLMFFRAVGVIPAGETNHLSSSCRRLSSFIIGANQLSIVVSQNLSCVSFSFFFPPVVAYANPKWDMSVWVWYLSRGFLKVWTAEC